MCDMTHLCVWHASFMRMTCLVHVCDMAVPYLQHASFIRGTCLTHLRDTNHPYVWHDWASMRKSPAECICDTWLPLVAMGSYVWPHQKLLEDGLSTLITIFSLICTISSELSVIFDLHQNRPRSNQPGPSWLTGSTPSIFQEAFRAAWLPLVALRFSAELFAFTMALAPPVRATWLIYLSDVTHHPSTWRDSFIGVSCLFRMCNTTTHSKAQQNPLLWATWLIHKYVSWLMNLYVRHDEAFRGVNPRGHTSNMTHTCV